MLLQQVQALKRRLFAVTRGMVPSTKPTLFFVVKLSHHHRSAPGVVISPIERLQDENEPRIAFIMKIKWAIGILHW